MFMTGTPVTACTIKHDNCELCYRLERHPRVVNYAPRVAKLAINNTPSPAIMMIISNVSHIFIVQATVADLLKLWDSNLIQRL
jgi:hypothetical protein